MEVEDERGRSFNAGEWKQKPNGLWELVIDCEALSNVAPTS